jgi:hypothetical protein
MSKLKDIERKRHFNTWKESEFKGMTKEAVWDKKFEESSERNGHFLRYFLGGIEECCSCHIAPPCSYCESLTEEELNDLD